MTGASACRRVVRAKCYAVHSGQFADSEARLILTPCQDKGMSSRTTRGYWKLGAIGCRGALWSEELDDKNSTERLERERIEGFPFSGQHHHIACLCLFHLLHSVVCLFQKIE